MSITSEHQISGNCGTSAKTPLVLTPSGSCQGIQHWYTHTDTRDATVCNGAENGVQWNDVRSHGMDRYGLRRIGMARILLELNTGQQHPASTKLGGVFAFASTAIFITALLDGSSSPSSASNSDYTTIHIPLRPSVLEFTFASANLFTVIITLTTSFVAEFKTRILNAFILAFTWPRLTFVITIAIYVI